MVRRLAAAVLVLFLGAPPARAVPTEPSLTILLGRTQWVTAHGCVPLTNAVPLDVVAQELGSRGLTATGSVTVARTFETGQYCKQGGVTYANWPQLAMLRDSYGWSFVSAGQSYRNMTTLSRTEQFNESCGSLAAFEQHGHAGADGLFAYPANRWTRDIQRFVVSTCFAYGRTYRGGINFRATTVAPWFQRTNSVNGGRCNDPTLPCYNLTSTPYRYWSPSRIASLFNVGSDQWAVVQMYRFVIGSRAAQSFAWDCTSSDWRDHWSSNSELYCWVDFLAALDRIPGEVRTVSPADVAAAWGR